MAFGNLEEKYGDYLPDSKEDIDNENLMLFFESMFERQEIWHKRFIKKKEQPWTKNEIFVKAKYTNVYRELDRASQWLIKNVFLGDFNSLEDFLFRLLIFRYINQPDTLNHPKYAIDLPHYEDFDEDKQLSLLLQFVEYRQKVGNPWHTAYTMNPAFFVKHKNQVPDGIMFKDYGYVGHLFPLLHKAIPTILKVIQTAKTPEEIIEHFKTYPSISDFQAHEFYIDLCYTHRYWSESIMKFDQNDFTNVGPGAAFGIRLIFPSLKNKKEQKQAIYDLRDIASNTLRKFGKFKYLGWDGKNYNADSKPNISLHQIEMWLCEFSKYWRMIHKIGKQRTKFIQKTF